MLLSRAPSGTAAADVQAHLGWAHWLNQHVAEREFPPNAAAERNFRAALATDPSNVYANAMLGNWMTITVEVSTEAVEHFNSAITHRESACLRQEHATGWSQRISMSRAPGRP